VGSNLWEKKDWGDLKYCSADFETHFFHLSFWIF